MCGISFVIHSQNDKASSRSKSYAGLFRDSLIAGAVRGTDSTGAFQITDLDKVYYAKSAQPSGIAVDTGQLSAIIDDVYNCPITVGHVRAATAGKVEDINAHPFIGLKSNEAQDYIIGVHNGTLYGWEYYDQQNKYAVDSEWAINQLATRGIEAFEDFYGAFAMVWYDTEHPGKVFLARNNERPLHIARSKDGHSIIGASESGMLQWLAQRNNLSIEDTVYDLEDGFLFSIDTNAAQLEIKMERTLPDCSWDYARTGRTPVMTTPTYTDVPFTTIPDAPALLPSPSPMVSISKLRVVEAVKDCLRQARYSLYDDSVLDYEADEVDESPVEMGPVDPIYKAKPDWYNHNNASLDERNKALYDGSYGTIVMYESVTYDQFTKDVVGEIVSPAVYKKPLAYLRDILPAEFGYYEAGIKPMVVVGMRWHKGTKEYIVTTLNEKGMEALAA